MTTPRRRLARRMLAAFLAAFPHYAASAARSVADVTPSGAFVNGAGVRWGAWQGRDEERDNAK